MRDTISPQQTQATRDPFELYGREAIGALALGGWVLNDTTGEPDRSEAALFLDVLDPSTDRFTFQTFDDVVARREERKRKHAETNKQRKAKGLKPRGLYDPYAHIIHGTLDERWKRLCELNAEGAGIFVTVNQTDFEGRSNDKIARLRARFVDLDGAPIEPVLQHDPPPRIVIESSPGKFQAYWPTVGDAETPALDPKEAQSKWVDVNPGARFKAQQIALAERFGSDPSVSDLARVMRLPGFIHRKATPFRSRIISLKDVPPCKPTDLVSEKAVDSINSFNDYDPFCYAREQKSPAQQINDLALANLSAWVPEIFPTAQPYHDGYRVSSTDLGRDNEEDLSLVPKGIKDFGVHDLDDPREGKRTPIDIVMEHVFEVPIEDIAKRNSSAEYQQAVDWLRERLPEPEEPTATTSGSLLQSSAEFVAGFVPPDYLIDGLLQRCFVYSFTAPTGWGKTAVALLIAVHVARGMPLAGREVEQGRVLFFAGENPDDIRTRWIKLCEGLKLDPAKVDVVFMPFTPKLAEKSIRKKIDAEAAERGPFSLLIVDTSAAYYSGNDENDNVQLGNHARMLRTFVNLPGGPTVLVTCHPAKAYDTDNLLPRGGGAFLAEVDGNLVAIKDQRTMVVEVTTHGKFRGPEFAPFAFKLVAGKSEKLVDSKGRSIWTIVARSISNEEQEHIEKQGHTDQDALLRAMLDLPGSSLVELATHLCWYTIEGGRPNKVKVQRMIKALAKGNKLVEQRRDGHYKLTKKGEEEAKQTPEDPVKIEPKT
jgi:AAA domain/RepB DNA-primase from phage plasmid